MSKFRRPIIPKATDFIPPDAALSFEHPLPENLQLYGYIKRTPFPAWFVYANIAFIFLPIIMFGDGLHENFAAVSISFLLLSALMVYAAYAIRKGAFGKCNIVALTETDTQTTQNARKETNGYELAKFLKAHNLTSDIASYRPALLLHGKPILLFQTIIAATDVEREVGAKTRIYVDPSSNPELIKQLLTVYVPVVDGLES